MGFNINMGVKYQDKIKFHLSIIIHKYVLPDKDWIWSTIC